MIKTVKSGGKTRHFSARIFCSFGHFDGLSRRHRKALGRAAGTIGFGDLVKLDLGLFDLPLGIDVFARIDGLFDHLAADADQRAEQRQLIDLRREIARADQRDAAFGELEQIGRSAERLDRLVGLEHRLERHRIGDHVAIDDHADDRLVDSAVRRLEEMIGVEDALDVVDEPVVDQQSAEQRRLGVDIVRQRQRPRGGVVYESYRFGHAALVA